MRRLLIGAMMLGTLAVVPVTVRAQDHDDHHDSDAHRKYYDRDHKDSHEWNDNENTAWGRYREEHREVKQEEFAKANRKQQKEYWKWRHEHPDAH